MAEVVGRLVFQKGLEQDGGEILRDGCAVFLCLLPQRVHGHQAQGDVEGVEGLGRAGVGKGRPIQPAPQGPFAGVTGIGILQLLPLGGLVDVQNPRPVGDGVAQLPQVDRQQGAQEHQGPRAVGNGVKDFQGDPVLVVENADQPVVVLVKAHRLAGIGHVRLHKGAGVGIGLKIAPKGPPADAHGKAGKAGHGLVHRPLEGFGVYGVGHQGRETIDRRVALPLDGGVEHAGVVQGIPRLFHLLPRHGQRPLSGKIYGHILAHRAGNYKGKKGFPFGDGHGIL